MNTVALLVGALGACVAMACGDTASNPAAAAGGAGSTGSGNAAGSANVNGGARAGGSGNGQSTPFEDYLPEYAEAYCQYLQRCRPPFDILQDDCPAFLVSALADSAFSLVKDAVADGRVKYAADQAPGCFEHVARADCGDNELVPCAGVLTGTKAAGESCTLDAECSDGQQCVVDGACPGRCAPPAKIGEGCTLLNRCAPDLVCRGDSGTTCVETATEGQSCSTDKPCRALLTCAEGTCVSGDKVAPSKQGGPCDLVGVPGCETGLVCTLALINDESVGRCQPPVASGAACTQSSPDACPAGEYCRITSEVGVKPANGKCQPTPKLGEECRYGTFWTAPCPLGLKCNTDTKVCEQGKHLNEACSSNQQCISGICDVDGTCQVKLECEAPSSM